MSRSSFLGLVTLLAFAALLWGAAPLHAITWREAQQQSDSWFKTDEAKQVVENVLLYQYPCGGWPKNLDFAKPLTAAQRDALKEREDRGIIDNGATHTHIRFLARAVAATDDAAARAACLRGVDYLLKAQYPNGGWPMFFPLRPGYYTHITYNDDAMASVLALLRDVGEGRQPFGFIDSERRARARNAVGRGIDCILKTQVVVDGRRTVWCAQHDEETLAPANARAYELPSLSGSESVGVTEFLMSIENPSPEVIAAVQGAIEWFRASKMTGIRVEERWIGKDRDRVIVQDPSAPPLWARFYELKTNRPMFVNRDGVPRYNYEELSRERRGGYVYIGDWPASLLDQKYPAWAAKFVKKG